MCELSRFIRSLFSGVDMSESKPMVHSIANNIQGFVDFMYPLEDEAVSRGYKRGIITAQVGEETGWGRKVIDKNLFNMKAGSSWKGEKVRVKTWEWTPSNKVYAYFRSFYTYHASLLNYIELISGWSNYAQAWMSRHDVNAYFIGIQAGQHKYATNPHYTSNCIACYNTIKDLV